MTLISCFLSVIGAKAIAEKPDFNIIKSSITEAYSSDNKIILQALVSYADIEYPQKNAEIQLLLTELAAQEQAIAEDAIRTAEQKAQAAKSWWDLRQWDGQVEAGVNIENGNTRSRKVNIASKIQREFTNWNLKFAVKGKVNYERGARTEEKYLANAEADYKLSSKSYLAIDAEYENDHFSGYDYRFSETIGYGRKIYDNKTLKLDVKAGIGGRHSQPSAVAEPVKHEAIFKPSANLLWQINDSWQFGEYLSATLGQQAIISKSSTYLKTKITQNMHIKLGLDLEHVSKVPTGVKKLDTTTYLNVVYDF